MLELPPLVTDIRRSRRERGAPKRATFPVSFPRGRPDGKGYSLVADDGKLMEWKGLEADLLALVVVSSAVAHNRGELTSQLIQVLLVETHSGSGEITGSIPEKVSGALGHCGRQGGDDRSGGGGLVEGRGNDGWVLRLAKFNA